MAEAINRAVVKARREAKGWDRKTLAQKAGVSQSVVTRLELGEQNDYKVSVLMKLARALEVTVDDLLVGSTPVDIGAGAPIPEFEAVVSEIGHLPEAHQRQVTALLKAYLSCIPE